MEVKPVDVTEDTRFLHDTLASRARLVYLHIPEASDCGYLHCGQLLEVPETNSIASQCPIDPQQ